MGYCTEGREEAIQRLGGCCQSSDCHWINEDESRGCTDIRCLQVIPSGDDPLPKKFGGWKYHKMLLDPEFTKKYRLLCANCNCIKRKETEPRQERRQVDGQWQVKIGSLWVPYTPFVPKKKRTRKDTVISQDLLNTVINRSI